MAQDILNYLQHHKPQMLHLLKRLVNLDSPSSERELVSAVIGEIGTNLEALGAQIEFIPTGGRFAAPLKAVWSGASEDAEPILILAHADTVWPPGEAERRPFSLADDRCFGPGVYDMKAGIVEAIFAIQALKSLNRFPSRPIVFLVTGDEEVGSPESRPIIEDIARSAAAVLVIEPPTEAGHLKTARKGVGMYELTVTGRAAHAGVEPEKGRSAVRELAEQILFLESLNNESAATTVTVGVIRGGTASNVVPATASAQIDVRVTTMAEAEKLDRIIRNLTPKTDGLRLEVQGGLNRPPMEWTEATGRLFDLARDASRELGFDLDQAMTGGGSDGNFTAALGVPTLDGLGAVGGGGHALDEYVSIPDLPLRAAMLARLLETIHLSGGDRMA